MFRRVLYSVAAVFACLAFVSADHDDVRKWTDESGSFSVEATLLQFDGKIVQLEKPTGDVVSVPIERLSRADQDFVKQQGTGSADPFAPPPAQWIDGKVVGVTDGDTLTVLDSSNVQHKIRLDGIDAPESAQDYGEKAKQALSSKVFGEEVRVRWREADKYGRTLGAIFVGDRWINRELVAEGWAWRYDEYSHSKLLKQAQENAKSDKIGLWADANDPVPPWIFRHPDKMREWNETRLAGNSPPKAEDEGPSIWERRAAAEAARPRPIMPAMSGGGSYWLNTNSGVRHNSSCQHYGNTQSGRYCGPGEGRACKICGG